MKVCVIGSGGREHALADVLGRDAEVVVTPGNPGIPGSVATPPEELEADLFVVGPEVPLVDGLADRLRASGRRVFGPGADGARLEGSKAWMKELVAAAGVPTARHGTFDSVEPAHAMLDTLTPPRAPAQGRDPDRPPVEEHLPALPQEVREDEHRRALVGASVAVLAGDDLRVGHQPPLERERVPPLLDEVDELLVSIASDLRREVNRLIDVEVGGRSRRTGVFGRADGHSEDSRW